MVEVRLHGALAKQFGKVWSFDISTPREAVSAIECARPGFRQAISKLAETGFVFRVRTPAGDRDDATVDMPIRGGRLDIVPIVQASSTGVRFVIGATLTYAGFQMGGPATPWGQFFISTGVSMMLGSVVEWLTPIQKKEENVRSGSWTISGADAPIEQGNPIPVIYGEVMTSGFPISGGSVAAQVAVTGSIDPSVSIGGESSIKVSTSPAGGDYFVMLHYTGAPFNLSEPFTWTWSRTGFAKAKNFEVLPSPPGTFSAKVRYTVPANTDHTDTGTIKVQLKARKLVDGTSVDVMAELPVKVFVDTRPFEPYRSSSGPYKVPSNPFNSETAYT